MTTLFTIGHSNHSIERFLELLRSHGIAAIADVRSRPYSRFVPYFSKQRLQGILEEEGIGYLYLGRELGGKPPHGEAPSEVPDCESRIGQPDLRAGIERLLEAAGQRRTAMMCRERDPLDCHRLHLICRYAKPLAGPIQHILPNGEVEPQAATERRLLARASTGELPLFGGDEALACAHDRWWQRGSLSQPSLSPDTHTIAGAP